MGQYLKSGMWKKWIALYLALYLIMSHGIFALTSKSKPSFRNKFDVSKLSKGDITKLRNIINRRYNIDEDDEVEDEESCIGQFEEQSGTIIRTKDSMAKGASFLKAPEVDTADECKEECCSDKYSKPCDLATFQDHQDAKEAGQPKCFLFSCTDSDGNFVCVTSPNSGYRVLKRKQDIEEENQLLDVARSEFTVEKTASTVPATSQTSTTTQRTETTTTTSAPTTTKTTTTTTMPTTTSEATTTTSTTTTVLMTTQKSCNKQCNRLEWKCDDGCCIEVTKVCNKNPDCRDSSDENQCQSLHPLESKSDTDKTSEPFQKTTIKYNPTTPSSVTAKEKDHSEVENTNLKEEELVSEKMDGERSALLPLALGLLVTCCVLLMVICRVRVMRKKLRRRGKPLTMEESDYLINGMYL